MNEWMRGYARACKAAGEYFQGRKRLAGMLPLQPRGKTLEGRIFRWLQDLQWAWCGKSAGERRDITTRAFAWYGSYSVASQDDPSMRGERPYLARFSRFERIRKHNLKRTRLIIGLRPDGFLEALRRAAEIAPKMRRCGRPTCEHPFFLARRSSDRYCSKECGLWGKRKAKREAWARNWKRWPSTRWRAKGGRKKYGKGKRR